MSLKEKLAVATAPESLLSPAILQFMIDNEIDLKTGKISRHQNEQEKMAAIKVILEAEENMSKKTVDGFHPSRLGGCPRAIFFDAFDAPIDIDKLKRSTQAAIGLMRMENGTFTHIRLQSIMWRMGILESFEDRAQGYVDDVAFSGRYDGIIKVKKGTWPSFRGEHGKRYLLEIKSANNKNFCLKAGGTPDEFHRLQIQIYLHILGLEEAILLYENKDNQNPHDELISYDPVELEAGVELARRFNRMIGQRRFPDKPKKAYCYTCEYEFLCKGGDRLKEFMDGLPEKTSHRQKHATPKPNPRKGSGAGRKRRFLFANQATGK